MKKYIPILVVLVMLTSLLAGLVAPAPVAAAEEKQFTLTVSLPTTMIPAGVEPNPSEYWVNAKMLGLPHEVKTTQDVDPGDVYEKSKATEIQLRLAEKAPGQPTPWVFWKRGFTLTTTWDSVLALKLVMGKNTYYMFWTVDNDDVKKADLYNINFAPWTPPAQIQPTKAPVTQPISPTGQISPTGVTTATLDDKGMGTPWGDYAGVFLALALICVAIVLLYFRRRGLERAGP